jgi:N-methylhydantoinase A
MGGTTAKAGLVERGTPRIAPHFEVGALASTGSTGAGYPVRTPVVDLVEVGAGGGSIAWIDPGGGLRVGPQSGGADPGPACYGLGQTEPCITDANLVLGRIDANYFLGGEHCLYPDLAERAVSKLGQELGLSLTEAARGIIEIANANMVAAIRLVSVQRGFDPREFTLVAFGGAGPMHANALAAELGIRRVLVPMSPGVTSALGLLVTDLKHDYVQAHLRRLDVADFSSINRVLEEFQQRGRSVLASEGVSEDRMSFTPSLDMRYVGQSFELRVGTPAHALTAMDAPTLADNFFREHERVYGYAATTEPVEIVNLRLTATGAIRRPELRRLPEGTSDSASALKDHRQVWFEESIRTSVYDRYQLRAGNVISGPAIVEEVDSTTVIHPGYHAVVDTFGNLILEQTP